MKGFLTITLLATLVLFAALPTIDQWERENDYPFGRLCEAFHQC